MILDSATGHVPVLLHEVRTGLTIQKGDTVVDATLGGGGYARALCEAIGERGTLVGIDADGSAVARASALLEGAPCKKHLIVGNFRDLPSILAGAGVRSLSAAVFDLGMSSVQLAHSGRGFSFQKDEPLVMTFSEHPGEADLTAAQIVNGWREESLANVLFGYGGEGAARKLARAIVEARQAGRIETTGALAGIVESVLPRRGKIHPATRTFQALRIAVNDELGALERGLSGAFSALAPGGRIAVVSFHSLEDRIVKRYFRALADERRGTVVTKRVVRPSSGEQRENPRSRSATLRIFEKNLKTKD